MEVSMRLRSTLAIGIGVLAVSWSLAANAEYFDRYNDGAWTNAQYNDGVCQYYYSFNAQTGENHVNRYGNCSQIAIGPDGRPLPVVPLMPSAQVMSSEQVIVQR
jgi:hypothetical protein